MDCNPLFYVLAILTIVHFTPYAQCLRSSLWGVILLDSEEGTTVNAGSVDPSSGRFDNQLTAFRYLGGAAAYDACSTMDQKNQVLYYAVDFQSSFIFAVDLKHNSVLPSICIPSSSFVVNLQWDAKKGRVFALAGFEQNTVTYVFSFGSMGNLPTQVIANLSSTGYKYFEFAAYDSEKDIYYFSYYDNYVQYIGYFNVDSFSTLKYFQISCPSTNISLHHLYYDNAHKSLLAIASEASSSSSSNSSFYMLQMSATGTDCTALALGSLTPPTSSSPIVTTATYDTDKEVLYTNVCYSDGSPCKLFTYTVRNQHMDNTTVPGGLIDIQVLL